MKKLHEDFLKFQAKTTPYPLGIIVDHAQGCYVHDTDGKAYLDFIAGVSACSIGHCNPNVVEAIKTQAERYLHLMVYGEFAQAPAVSLSKELIALLPENHQSVYLTNSGTEAIEGALKLAKRATGRSELIGAQYSYHGSTHGALSLLGSEHQKVGYRPLLPDIRYIRFNQEEDLNLITEKTAAVLLETIQGGAGFIVPQNDYLAKVKKRCEDVGALMIVDEIQTGIGRTGKFWGFENYGIIPDIIITGKGLGGGMPIGACIAQKKLMDLLKDQPKLGHITTFGGHPVIASAAVATVNTIQNSTLIEETLEKEKLIRKLLKHPKIKEIRGKGLMLGAIVESNEIAANIIHKCLEEGLIFFFLLFEGKAIRITPPLTISKKEISKGCEIIMRVIDNLEQ